MKDAFHQIVLEEDSKEYVTIVTHKGLFRYQVLPFGPANAPAVFQRTIEQILQGIENVIVYLDDITIVGKTIQEHLETLEKVLKRLQEFGFKVNIKKCEFLKSCIQFLGHIVDANGIRLIPEKIEAIVKMPPPKDLKQLQSFLGMVEYYSKFVPMLSTELAPLNKLRRKDEPWNWGKEQQTTFEKTSVVDIIRSFGSL